jgi:hypothetical protein
MCATVITTALENGAQLEDVHTERRRASPSEHDKALRRKWPHRFWGRIKQHVGGATNSNR